MIQQLVCAITIKIKVLLTSKILAYCGYGAEKKTKSSSRLGVILASSLVTFLYLSNSQVWMSSS